MIKNSQYKVTKAKKTTRVNQSSSVNQKKKKQEIYRKKFQVSVYESVIKYTLSFSRIFLCIFQVRKKSAEQAKIKEEEEDDLRKMEKVRGFD